MIDKYSSSFRQVVKLLDAPTSRERYELFDDFVEVCALGISNHFDPVHYEQRRQRMMTLLKKHGTPVMERFQKAYTLLGHIALSHFTDGELVDVMGYLFYLVALADQGQLFTPPDVTRLMAQLALIHNGGHKEQGFMDLCDHALGSDGTLIAASELLMQQGYNINKDFVLCGNDIDLRCVHMAYIQASIYGLPAVFCHGNTITLEEQSKWWTPMYIKGYWVMRKPFSMKGGPNREDQLLKITTGPQYGATLEAYRLMCGITTEMDGEKQDGTDQDS